MGVFSKNLCQDSLRFMSCVSRSDIVPGPFFSQPAPLENMRFGKAFSAGFRRRTTRQVDVVVHLFALAFANCDYHVLDIGK